MDAFHIQEHDERLLAYVRHCLQTEEPLLKQQHFCSPSVTLLVFGIFL